MKKIKIFILFFVVCLCFDLSSCSCKSTDDSFLSSVPVSETISSNTLGNFINGKTYTIDTDYLNALKNSDGSIATFVDITVSYGDKWKEQIKVYYDKLYSQLDADGQKVLKQSQDDWEKFNGSDDIFNQYLMNHYEPTGGMNAAVNYITLYRSRAVELMEKCQQIGLPIN